VLRHHYPSSKAKGESKYFIGGFRKFIKLKLGDGRLFFGGSLRR
jgi:hypothetical protein